MSDTNHKVLVTFEGDSKNLDAETKKSTSIVEKFRKKNKENIPNLLKQQKKQSAETIAQNKALKEQIALYDKLSKAAARPTVAQREAAKAARTIAREQKKAEDHINREKKKQEQELKRSRESKQLFRGGGGGLGSAAGMVGGAALTALAALVSMPFQAITSQYDSYQGYAKNLANVSGYAGGGATADSMKMLRNIPARKLGYTPEEAINATALTARATGSADGAGSTMAVSRLLGTDMNQTAGMFGTIRQGGTTGFSEGGAGYKQLTRAIAAGMVSGIEKSRMPEFLEGVMTMTQQGASRAGGTVTTGPYAQLLATLGRSGQAGLQGARGAAVGSALEQGFRNPGGGDEGQLRAMAAMGYGNGASYYQARKAVQLGSDGKGQADFVRRQIEYNNASFGGPGEEANLALEQILGGSLSLDQIESVQAAMAAGESDENLSNMIRSMTESETDVLKDIRRLLSGDNDPLLEETRRMARYQADSVDVGESLHTSMESVHDSFHEFIMENQTAMVNATKAAADALTALRPIMQAVSGGILAMTDLLRGMGEIAKNLDVIAEGFGFSSSDKKKVSGSDQIINNMMKNNAEMLVPNANLDESQIRNTMEAGSAALFIRDQGIDRNDPAIRGMTEYNRTEANEAFKTRAEDAAIQLLEAAFRAAQRNHGGNAPNIGPSLERGREMREVFAYLASVQLTVPPSYSAVFDSTGGQGER